MKKIEEIFKHFDSKIEELETNIDDVLLKAENGIKLTKQTLKESKGSRKVVLKIRI